MVVFFHIFLLHPMQTIVISPFNPKLVINLMMTTAYISEQTSLHFEGAMGAINPKSPLGCYAQTYFLFVICLSAYRLQWNPIAPSKRKDSYSKI